MTMKMITLENNFHGTTVKVRPRNVSQMDNPSLLAFVLSDRQYKRADKALCGMKDCRCGGVDRAAIEVAANRDGSYTFWI